MNEKKRVLVVLATGFEEVEALTPADILVRLGCEVVFAGLEPGFATGAHGIRIGTDMSLEDAENNRYDAIVLPGGMPGAAHLRDSALLAKMLRRQNDAGRICAAICAAPAVLETSGVRQGRTVTGYPGCEKLSGSDALRFSGRMTERAGNLVTGKGPGASFLFGAELAKALGFSESAVAELLAGMIVNA